VNKIQCTVKSTQFVSKYLWCQNLFTTTFWCIIECKRYVVFFNASNFFFECYLCIITTFSKKIFMPHTSCLFAL